MDKIESLVKRTESRLKQVHKETCAMVEIYANGNGMK